LYAHHSQPFTGMVLYALAPPCRAARLNKQGGRRTPIRADCTQHPTL
jgi:hypothetical protein